MALDFAIARRIREARRIVCQRRRELDLIVVDFDNGIRRMTLLSALGSLRDQLRIVALTAIAPPNSLTPMAPLVV